MKRFFLFMFFVFFAYFLQAQIISGKIVDENDNPLVGASVIIKNTFLGTSSDLNGDFSIKSKFDNCEIVISYLGFESISQNVKLNGKNQNLGKLVLKPSAYMSDEVIVKATRADDNSPIAFISMDKEDLQKRNTGQDLPYMLELTPSVVASSEAGTGVGNTSFRVRGTDPTRINITVNGIPLNDSESQAVFWANMPDFASSVNNLQLTRGVGSSTNGAAAFGASMNIFTGSLSNKPYAEISSMMGSFNTFKENLKIGTGILKNGFSFDLRLSKLDSDGYVENSYSDHYSMMMSAAWRGKTSFVRANIIRGNQKTGITWYGCPQEVLDTNRIYNPAGEYFDEFGNRKMYKDNADNYIQTHYQIIFSKDFKRNLDLSAGIHYTRGDGYYEQYKMEQKFSKYLLPNIVLQPDPIINGLDTLIPNAIVINRSDLVYRKQMANDFYGATSSLNYKNEKLKLSFGAGWNKYDGDHFGNILWMKNLKDLPINYEWYRNYGEKTEFNVFSKINYEIAKSLYLYGDLQYRNIRYFMQGEDYELDMNGNLIVLDQEHKFNFINPKAGLFYDISDKMNVYASFAVANREPTRTNFKDAAGDTLKTPKAERLYDYELGYNYRSQRFSALVNLYYMDYIDQLIPTGEKSNTGYDIMTNVAESYRAGIELVANYKPINKLSLEANLTLSRNKIKDFVSWAATYDEDWNENYESFDLGERDIAYSPNIISSGIVSYKPFAGFNISWIAKYVGAQYFDNTSSPNRKLDPYFVNNLQLDYSIETKFIKEINFSFIVNNIFNLKYSNNAYGGMWYEQGVEKTWAYYFPQAGINFMGGINLKF
jgi:iron complex outermembrane receptor protein